MSRSERAGSGGDMTREEECPLCGEKYCNVERPAHLTVCSGR